MTLVFKSFLLSFFHTVSRIYRNDSLDGTPFWRVTTTVFFSFIFVPIYYYFFFFFAGGEVKKNKRRYKGRP